MANRTWHMAFGFIVYLVFSIIFLARFGIRSQDRPWMVLGFGLSMFGAELPDYDQLFDRLLNHRDMITHSFFIPVIVFIIVRFLAPMPAYTAIAPLLFLVLLGHASHMFLDLFPVWEGSKKQVQGKKATGGLQTPVTWLIEGVTGQELYKKLEGTYLIHLPVKIPDEEGGEVGKRRRNAKPKERRTFGKNRTRLWLALNGLIDTTLAIFVLNSYETFLPFGF